MPVMRVEIVEAVSATERRKSVALKRCVVLVAHPRLTDLVESRTAQSVDTVVEQPIVVLPSVINVHYGQRALEGDLPPSADGVPSRWPPLARFSGDPQVSP
jgi:hypothetical protein